MIDKAWSVALLLLSCRAQQHLACESVTLLALPDDLGFGNHFQSIQLAARMAKRCGLPLQLEVSDVIKRICARLACVGATVVERFDARTTQALDILTWRAGACRLADACRARAPRASARPPPPRVFAQDAALWSPAEPTCVGGGAPAADFDAAVHVRSIAADFERARRPNAAAAWNASAMYDGATWREIAALVVHKAWTTARERERSGVPRVYVAADIPPIREELVGRLRERGVVVCVCAASGGAIVHSRRGDAASDDAALSDWLALSRAAVVYAIEMRCKGILSAECHAMSAPGDGLRLSSFLETATAAKVTPLRDGAAEGSAPPVLAVKRVPAHQNATGEPKVRVVQARSRRRWSGAGEFGRLRRNA